MACREESVPGPRLYAPVRRRPGAGCSVPAISPRPGDAHDRARAPWPVRCIFGVRSRRAVAWPVCVPTTAPYRNTHCLNARIPYGRVALPVARGAPLRTLRGEFGVRPRGTCDVALFAYAYAAARGASCAALWESSRLSLSPGHTGWVLGRWALEAGAGWRWLYHLFANVFSIHKCELMRRDPSPELLRIFAACPWTVLHQ